MNRLPDGSSPRNPALTVDGVVLARPGGARRDEPGSVLLIRRGGEPFAGSWALPGGFVDYGENPDAAVRREIAEETGLRNPRFVQFRSYGDPGRDPRGHTVSIVYLAELRGTVPPVAAGDDAAEAAWFDLDRLPPLAFDHADILSDIRRFLAGRS